MSKASDLLVDCLEREGVEYVFGLPGEEIEDLLFSLRNSTITFVPVRHEQGAAFMADVYGRLTGDAGVCLSTLGPGATNLLTGIADATLDKVPVVAITGQGGLERLHKESHQALDIVAVLAPVTKWNTQINSPDVIHESVRKAFKVAEWEKPGATHLALPEDVAVLETEAKPLPRRHRDHLPEPDIRSIKRLENYMVEAERPIIIAGNGVVRTKAVCRLREFVELTEIPVTSTYMGKGAVSDDDPRSLMTINSGDQREAADAVRIADLIMTIGYDPAEHEPAEWNPKADATVVHIDTVPAEVDEHYNPNVEVISDISGSLRVLTERCEEMDLRVDTNWYRDLREHIICEVTHPPPTVTPSRWQVSCRCCARRWPTRTCSSPMLEATK